MTSLSVDHINMTPGTQGEEQAWTYLEVTQTYIKLYDIVFLLHGPVDVAAQKVVAPLKVSKTFWTMLRGERK